MKLVLVFRYDHNSAPAVERPHSELEGCSVSMSLLCLRLHILLQCRKADDTQPVELVSQEVAASLFVPS